MGRENVIQAVQGVFTSISSRLVRPHSTPTRHQQSYRDNDNVSVVAMHAYNNTTDDHEV